MFGCVRAPTLLSIRHHNGRLVVFFFFFINTDNKYIRSRIALILCVWISIRANVTIISVRLCRGLEANTFIFIFFFFSRKVFFYSFANASRLMSTLIWFSSDCFVSAERKISARSRASRNGQCRSADHANYRNYRNTILSKAMK